MAKRKITEDVSTEEKIKQAARRLFTEKGFDGVKTRDIAEAAGINLALLNYYFRSKQKLFDIVMIENFEQFIQQMIPVFSDKKLSVDEIFAQAAINYIDMLKSNPGLPFFIMNEMRGNSSKLDTVRQKMLGVREGFINKIEQGMKDGKISPVNMTHLMMNFMGLIVFPFVAQTMMMKVNGLNPKQFDALMEERKKLVPIWLKAIMTAKY
jgi:AcrR family transcriptional regulator